MVMIIDGDNSPGTNVRKLGQLDEKDKVIIYYASDNGFFTKEGNRISLIENTRCSVEFKCIPAGNCAVDLAVAMDMGIMLENDPAGVLVLVSKDKHFKIIQNLMKSESHGWYVAQAPDIDDAVQNYKVLETTSLDGFRDWLIHLFGKEIGTEMYERLEAMFKDSCAKRSKMSENARKSATTKERLFSAHLSDIMLSCRNSKSKVNMLRQAISRRL